ncbi:hypothetical protein [Nostoc sp. KVJ20]|nr:hypothetical protein [Nostoc sp. KVJ20]
MLVSMMTIAIVLAWSAIAHPQAPTGDLFSSHMATVLGIKIFSP